MTPASVQSLKSPRTLVLLKAIVSIALLLAFFHYINVADVWTKLQSSEAAWIAVGIALTGVNLLLSAIRWWRVLQIFRLRVDLFSCFKAYSEAVAFNLVLPGSIGGDVVRVYRLGQKTKRFERVFHTAVVDRFGSLVALLPLMLLTSPYLLGDGSIPDLTSILMVMVGGLAVGLAALFALPLGVAFRRVVVYRYVIRLALGLRRVLSQPLRSIEILVWSLLIQISSMGMLFAAMAATVSWSQASFSAAILGAVLSILAAALPLSLAGIGLREGAVILVLQFHGFDESSTYATALIFGVFALIICLPGIAFWMASPASQLPPSHALRRGQNA